MDEQERAERAHAALGTEIERLRAHAATSVSPCDVAKLIAVSDERVIERLLTRLGNGDQPRGVRCIGVGRVLFAFDCPPGTLCLLPRSFLVLVDLAARTVTEILDPYDSEEGGQMVATSVVPRARPSAARAAAALATAADADPRVRVLSSPSAALAVSPALAAAPSAPPSVPDIVVLAAEAGFTLTVKVPGIAFKALLFGTTRFDFSGDQIEVTLPVAGTYEFDLVVKDFANRTFEFEVTTSTGGSLKRTAALDGQGENTLRIRVTVP